MKKLILLVFIVIILTSCYPEHNKYDKLILTDENTGKKYLLKAGAGDTYFIDEMVIKISGKDTIKTFE